MPPWILWREKTDGQRDSQGELGYNPATRPCVPKENGGGGQTGKATEDIVAFLGYTRSVWGANRQGWRHCSLLRSV